MLELAVKIEKIIEEVVRNEYTLENGELVCKPLELPE